MQNNIATIQHIYECFGKGDVPGILEKLDDNVQWEAWGDNQAQTAGVPWLKARVGKEAVLGFFQYLGSSVQMTDFQVLHFMEGDKQVAVEAIIGAQVLATGTHYLDEEIHLWTFNDQGKVTRMRHYTDTLKHARAAQLI